MLADDDVNDEFVKVVKVVPWVIKVIEGALELAESVDLVLLTEAAVLEVCDVEVCVDKD